MKYLNDFSNLTNKKIINIRYVYIKNTFFSLYVQNLIIKPWVFPVVSKTFHMDSRASGFWLIKNQHMGTVAFGMSKYGFNLSIFWISEQFLPNFMFHTQIFNLSNFDTYKSTALNGHSYTFVKPELFFVKRNHSEPWFIH